MEVKLLRRLFRIISCLIFVASSVALTWMIIVEPYLENKNQDEIKSIYYEQSNSNNINSDSNNSNHDVEDKLKKVNPDIIGWISIANTNIDYPVLQSDIENPNFYLSHDYKKANNKHGSIFLDSHCKMESSQNLILHGHHMRDGTMFANLIKFNNLDFYKQHPLIEFGSINNISKWKIVSIFKANTDPKRGETFVYIRPSFIDDGDLTNYLYNIKSRSIINIPVDVDNSDSLLTLSTCSYEFDGCRMVVVARKVRSGETDFVDVENAKKS